MTQEFEFSTHDLPRSPGSSRDFARTITLPVPLGTEVIAIPAQEAIEISGTMQSVHEGVLFSGQVAGLARGECVRCLEAAEEEVDVAFQEMFAYPGTQGDIADEAERLSELHEDVADILEPVTDAVVLELPFQPLCEPDCLGLCPECGVRLADAEPGHAHEILDPRWSALASLSGSEADSDRHEP